MTDPKLIEAMAEIEAVVKKHDIAAHIALNSRVGGVFKLMPASWSKLVERTPGKGDYRLEYQGPMTPELEVTIAWIYSLDNVFRRACTFFDKLKTALAQGGVTVERDPIENRIEPLPPAPKKTPENVH